MARPRMDSRHATCWRRLSLETLESRHLLSSIRGSVWLDGDGNGQRSPSEPAYAAVGVYLDLNANAAPDENEPFTQTCADGSYQFDGLAAGEYIVRQIRPAGTVATLPASEDFQRVVVGAPQLTIFDFNELTPWNSTGPYRRDGFEMFIPPHEGNQFFIEPGAGSTALAPGLTGHVFLRQQNGQPFDFTGIDLAPSLTTPGFGTSVQFFGRTANGTLVSRSLRVDGRDVERYALSEFSGVVEVYWAVRDRYFQFDNLRMRVGAAADAVAVNFGNLPRFSGPLIVSTLVDEANGGNSGNGLSLREALAEARFRTFSNITFASNITSGFIQLDPNLGQLEIRSDLAIHGPIGGAGLSVDAQRNSRALTVAQGVSAAISRLSFLNGVTSEFHRHGGGIYSLGRLLLADLNVAFNDTTIDSFDHGGGIYADFRSELELVRTNVTNNNSDGWAGGVAAVGATLTIRDSTIARNWAQSGYGGGGVWATGPLTVENSYFHHNTGGGGGAIHFSSASGVESWARIRDSRFESNSGSGGAIGGATQDTLIERSLFSDNTGNIGGAISAQGYFRLVDSIVQNNRANSGGGGIHTDGVVTLDGVLIENNQVTNGNGGGIYNNAAQLVVMNSAIIGNTALGINANFKDGGGIFNQSSHGVRLTNVTMSGNKATRRGGAIYNRQSGLVIEHSTIAGNQSAEGSGIYTTDNEVLLTNTIVAENTHHDLVTHEDVFGPFLATSRYNLIGAVDGANGFADESNLTGSRLDPFEAGLEPLQYFGGALLPFGVFLPVRPLGAGSGAINAGDPLLDAGVGGVPIHDQRGAPFIRVFGGRIDIGAVETISHDFLPGDFNGDQIVDAADYSRWRDELGSPDNVTADGNGDGAVDERDYLVWKYNFGTELALSPPLRSVDSGGGSLTSAATEVSSSTSLPPRFDTPITSLLRPKGRSLRESRALDRDNRSDLLLISRSRHTAGLEPTQAVGRLSEFEAIDQRESCQSLLDIAFATWDRLNQSCQE